MARIGWAGRIALLSLATTGLSGCVAVAALPAVAGGFAAKKAGDYAATTRARKQAGGVQTARQTGEQQMAEPAPRASPARRSAAPGSIVAGPLPPPTASSAPPRADDKSLTATPMPADMNAMRPGVAYTGALPSPDATPAPAPVSAKPMRWTDVGRYVAALPAAPVDSALLIRGSTSEAPAWVPCAGRPRALLVRLETAMTEANGRWQLDRKARQWLEAFQTLEMPVVFTSPAAPTAQPAITAAFRDAGLGKLLDLGALRLSVTPAAMPAARASVAAERCIVAVVGRDASDFPNALLPATSPPALASRWGAGWFRLDDN